MSVEGRLVLLKDPLKGEWLHINRKKTLKTASLCTHFALGFMTGCVRIFADCGPFGVAMTARAGGGVGGLMCLLGAAAGYTLSGGLGWSLRYMAALIMTYTAAFLCRETAAVRRVWFMPSVSAFIMALTGALNCVGRAVKLSTAVDLATEVALTGVGAYLFTMALTNAPLRREQEELRRDAGSILLLCCLLMALGRITVLRVICVGRVLAVFCVMVSAFGGGASMGAFVGVVSGLAMDLAAGGPALFTVCYGFAGLVSGALKRQGRLLFLLLYIAADAMAVLWNWDAENAVCALYETFVASVVFLVLPARTMTLAVSTVRPAAAGGGESALRRYTAGRTGELADAFRELFETVQRSAESKSNDADIATIYDRAAEAVCASCPAKDTCWQINYLDTLNMLNDATSAMRKRGRMEPEDLPERFRAMCRSPESFTAAVNMELRALLYRRHLRARLEENRTAAYGQYRYLAGVLDAVSADLRSSAAPDPLAERRLLRYFNGKDLDADVAVFRDPGGRLRVTVESARLPQLLREQDYLDQISDILDVRMCRPAALNRGQNRLVLLEAEPLAVSVGVAAMKKEGEPVSGDRGTYFKTEQGVLCVLLSDGMGSGEAAARESIGVVRILERFLRSGVEPGTAMKLLNSMLLLRGGESWGYAAVDLMCIDLFTGQTGFYKYGAAPSYIRSGKTVRRVKGASMAAGILAEDGEAPDVVRMRLRPGGVAIIASDGGNARDDEGGLRELLLGFDGTDTRALAGKVLRRAAERYGCSDDMTVLAIRVEERR